MSTSVRVASIGELASIEPGTEVRLNVLLQEYHLGPDAGRGTLFDETGICSFTIDFREHPDLRKPASELLDGFVLAVRMVVQRGGVELVRPEDLLGVEIFLRPEHDLRRFAGRSVTLTGLVARIGWLTGRGIGLLMLSDGGPGAWIVYRFLEDPGLLSFAQNLDFTGFVAVRGTVVPLALDPSEPLFPPRFALFRGVPEDAELFAVQLASAEDIVLADPGEPLPRYDTNCLLGQQLGCQTLCCSRQVRLTSEEVGRGLEHIALPGGIAYLRREADGYCYAMDRATGRCGVYEIRPKVCLDFSCIHEPSIVERLTRNGPIDQLPMFIRIDSGP